MEEGQKPRRKGLPVWEWIIIGFFVLAIIGAISNRSAPSTPTTESSPASPQQTSAPATPPPPIQVSAITLTADYVNNQFAADEKYKDKVLDVSGTISDIDRDVFGNPFVELDTGQGIENTVFNFTNNATDTASLANISVGESLTIQGTCKGKTGTEVDMEDCSIIPNNPTPTPTQPPLSDQQSSQSTASPAATAGKIEDLLLHQQYSELYAYLDPDDQAQITQQEFVVEYTNALSGASAYQATYSIDSTDVIMLPTWTDPGNGKMYNNIAEVPYTETIGNRSSSSKMHLIQAPDGTWRFFHNPQQQ